MKQIALFFVLLLIIFSTACSTQDASPTPTPTQPSDDAASPPPATVTAQTGSEVEVSASSGAVIGTLLLSSHPVSGQRLALAEILKDDSGQERAAGFQRSDSPATITNEDGSFTFGDIPPGRYGLVLDTGVNSYLLLKPDSADDPLTMTVVAGEKLDLGTLSYSELPIPGDE